MKKILFSVLLCANLLWSAQAAIEAYKFDNPQTEEDYKVLIEELRCLVCQNQNLAASDADLAKDLRKQTYDMLQAGKSRDQVVEYMVNRYGDFVLYRPPIKSNTYLLWLGPFVLLVIVLVIVVMRVRKADPQDAPEQINLEQAKNLLSEESKKQ